jgi:hypothetical protein
VSVWTAAEQTYGSFIVGMLFDVPHRQCKAFFHRHHCELSERATKHLKSLEWLSTVGARDIYPSHVEMILVDDRPNIVEANKLNAIVVDAFNGNPADSALWHLMRNLKMIVNSNILMDTS